jgi:hypothetical protein
MYNLNLLKTIRPEPKPTKPTPGHDWTAGDLKFAKAVGIDLGGLGGLKEAVSKSTTRRRH